MSLADRLEAGPTQRRNPCRVRRILETLSDKEAAALTAMMNDPKWSDAMTYEAMRDEGVGIGLLPETDQFLGHHRRGRCDCPVSTSLPSPVEK